MIDLICETLWIFFFYDSQTLDLQEVGQYGRNCYHNYHFHVTQYWVKFLPLSEDTRIAYCQHMSNTCQTVEHFMNEVEHSKIINMFFSSTK